MYNITISQLISAFFKSNEMTLKPNDFAMVPTLPVPLNNSNKFILIIRMI